MLEVLDLCDTTKSSARRLSTSVAPQALTLFNGKFVNEQAERLADRLEREVGNDAARQIDRAWILALARPPKPAERDSMVQFLATEASRLEAETKEGRPAKSPDAARREALVQLCRVIFNLNEFAYPD